MIDIELVDNSIPKSVFGYDIETTATYRDGRTFKFDPQPDVDVSNVSMEVDEYIVFNDDVMMSHRIASSKVNRASVVTIEDATVPDEYPLCVWEKFRPDTLSQFEEALY